jgi:hypothetical protein
MNLAVVNRIDDISMNLKDSLPLQQISRLFTSGHERSVRAKKNIASSL